MKYKIWVPEFEAFDDARIFNGSTVREAVDFAAYDEFERNGQFDELEFHVRNEDTGEVFKVDVGCECDPSFYIGAVKKDQVLNESQAQLVAPLDDAPTNDEDLS